MAVFCKRVAPWLALGAMAMVPAAGAATAAAGSTQSPPAPLTTAGPAEVVASLPDTEAAGVAVTPKDACS